MMIFTGKVAISTGAASGMGLLFAQNWADLGGNVVLCDVNEQELNEKVAEINSKNCGKAIDLCPFLASEKGQFINGENIMIDGGRNAMKRCK